MINTILVAALLVGSVYIGYRVYTRYRRTTGTTWERLLATAKGSATIFMQYLVIIGSAAISGISYLAEVVNMPEVRDWIQSSLKPEYVGAALAAIAVVTIASRLRTIGD